MIQETLFDLPAQSPAPSIASKIPPKPPKPTTLAEPLGPCAKCGKPAVISSPSGNPKSIYCEQCGHCGRWYINRQSRCNRSIEDFVLHPRLGIWVCPCMILFEIEMQKKEREIIHD